MLDHPASGVFLAPTLAVLLDPQLGLADHTLPSLLGGIDQLTEYGVVELDNERKAMMVNNLLVALVADSEAQPVINTGTVY